MKNHAENISLLSINELASEKQLRQIERLSTNFSAGKDTILHYHGIARAANLFKSAFPGLAIKLLDIGCNTGFPGYRAVKCGEVDSVIGLEINPDAVRRGKQFWRNGRLSQKAVFLQGNMLEDKQKALVKSLQPNLVVGNLPYLPAPGDSETEVFGGKDGTLYVPGVILDYAVLTDSPIAAMSLCSLVDIRTVFEAIHNSKYFVTEVSLLKSPFGAYSKKYDDQGFYSGLSYKPYFHTEQDGTKSQVVINLVLAHKTLAAKTPEVPEKHVLKMLEEFSNSGSIRLGQPGLR